MYRKEKCQRTVCRPPELALTSKSEPKEILVSVCGLCREYFTGRTSYLTKLLMPPSAVFSLALCDYDSSRRSQNVANWYDVIFHNDNAKPHAAIGLGCFVIYSLDSAPTDYHTFRAFNNSLQRKDLW